MTARRRSPLYQWEQEMIDAYYDDQSHRMLDPLYGNSKAASSWMQPPILNRAFFSCRTGFGSR